MLGKYWRTTKQWGNAKVHCVISLMELQPCMWLCNHLLWIKVWYLFLKHDKSCCYWLLFVLLVWTASRENIIILREMPVTRSFRHNNLLWLVHFLKSQYTFSKCNQLTRKVCWLFKKGTYHKECVVNTHSFLKFHLSKNNFKRKHYSTLESVSLISSSTLVVSNAL